MDNQQSRVARSKFSSFLSPAQLEFKIHRYESAAKRTYDPQKGAYQTHLANHLNKLNRDVHNSMHSLGISETNGLSIHKMSKAHDEFFLQHDRKPTAEELSSVTGVPPRFISKYQDSIGKGMTISREANISPISLDFDSFTEGLEKDDIDTAGSTVGTREKPTGTARSSFFRKAKKARDKMKKNYLSTQTRIIYDS